MEQKERAQKGFYKETELTKPSLLCDSRGKLLKKSIGWSRHPLHTCNLKRHWLRKKRWNYWCVFSDKYLFSITLANLDYLGIATAYFLEYETKKFIEQSVLMPLGRGCNLSDEVSGDIILKNKAMNLSILNEQQGTKISVDSSSFGGLPLLAELFVKKVSQHETLNVVVPWGENQFQFTSKQFCLPAEGHVLTHGKSFDFSYEKSFAVLDFGRGVWPYSTVWNWASCSGTVNGHIVGLNLGGKWTDGTGMTENAIFVDGEIIKLSEDIVFSYDPHDFIKPWAIKTELSDQVNIQFFPFYERIAKIDLLILKSEDHQLFGRFSGTIITDAGKAIQFKDIIGWAEEHKARW